MTEVTKSPTPLPPIAVELRIEFPPILAHEYTLTESRENILTFRSRVNDTASVVAQIREYADQLEMTYTPWAFGEADA